MNVQRSEPTTSPTHRPFDLRSIDTRVRSGGSMNRVSAVTWVYPLTAKDVLSQVDGASVVVQMVTPDPASLTCM
jgi:hypothetical protein